MAAVDPALLVRWTVPLHRKGFGHVSGPDRIRSPSLRRWTSGEIRRPSLAVAEVHFHAKEVLRKRLTADQAHAGRHVALRACGGILRVDRGVVTRLPDHAIEKAFCFQCAEQAIDLPFGCSGWEHYRIGASELMQ